MENDLSLRALLGDALLLMAKWLWKSKMETPQIITSQYLQQSLRTYKQADVDKATSSKGRFPAWIVHVDTNLILASILHVRALCR